MLVAAHAADLVFLLGAGAAEAIEIHVVQTAGADLAMVLVGRVVIGRLGEEEHLFRLRVADVEPLGGEIGELAARDAFHTVGGGEVIGGVGRAARDSLEEEAIVALRAQHLHRDAVGEEPILKREVGVRRFEDDVVALGSTVDDLGGRAAVATGVAEIAHAVGKAAEIAVGAGRHIRRDPVVARAVDEALEAGDAVVLFEINRARGHLDFVTADAGPNDFAKPHGGSRGRRRGELKVIKIRETLGAGGGETDGVFAGLELDRAR